MKKIILLSFVFLIFQVHAFDFDKIKEKIGFNQISLDKKLEKAILNLDLDQVIEAFESKKFEDIEALKKLLEISKTLRPSKYPFLRTLYWFLIIGISRIIIQNLIGSLEKVKIDQPLENFLCKLLNFDSKKMKNQLEMDCPKILVKAYYHLSPFNLVLQRVFDIYFGLFGFRKYLKIANEASEIIALRCYLQAQLKRLLKKENARLVYDAK